jgi:hypothetical protein
VNEPDPIACTLDESNLRQRLDEIAALGAASLLGHESKDGAHILRFHPDEETHQRLEQITAAEARCCPFLDLSVGEDDGKLLLTISSAKGGEQAAEMLALSFLHRD